MSNSKPSDLLTEKFTFTIVNQHDGDIICRVFNNKQTVSMLSIPLKECKISGKETKKMTITTLNHEYIYSSGRNFLSKTKSMFYNALYIPEYAAGLELEKQENESKFERQQAISRSYGHQRPKFQIVCFTTNKKTDNIYKAKNISGNSTIVIKNTTIVAAEIEAIQSRKQQKEEQQKQQKRRRARSGSISMSNGVSDISTDSIESQSRSGRARSDSVSVSSSFGSVSGISGSGGDINDVESGSRSVSSDYEFDGDWNYYLNNISYNSHRENGKNNRRKKSGRYIPLIKTNGHLLYRYNSETRVVL